MQKMTYAIVGLLILMIGCTGTGNDDITKGQGNVPAEEIQAGITETSSKGDEMDQRIIFLKMKYI